jgi:two-component system, sensor histidine kinase YesM
MKKAGNYLSKKFREKTYTLRTRITLFFSIIIILSIFISGYISYYNFYTSYKAETTNYANVLIEQLTANLDSYLNEMELTVKQLALNKTALSYFKDYFTGKEYENLVTAKKFDQEILNIENLNPDIANVMIYNLKTSGILYRMDMKNTIKLDNNFLKAVWDKNEKSELTKSIFYGKHPTDYILSSYKDEKEVITVSFPVRDYSKYDNFNYAVAMVDFDFSKIKDIINSDKTNRSFSASIYSNDKKLVFSNNDSQGFKNDFEKMYLNNIFIGEKGTFIKKIQNKSYQIFYETSKVTGWKVVFFFELTQLENKLTNITRTTFALIIISIFLTLIVSTLISIKQIKPITELSEKMKLVEKGDLSARMKLIHSSEEVNVLNRGFNNMMDKIDELIQEIYISKIRQNEAEFDALQSKINPHFLYNTLQSITSLAILERTRDIEKVTTSLGNLLEYLIYEQNELVSVYSEVEYIISYLKIQSIRYNNSFETFIEIDEEIYHCKIIKLLIQPFIENAILHGLEKKQSGGYIRVSGKKQNDCLIFEIVDNGIGMDEDNLRRISERLEACVNDKTGKSIGILNVQQRIKLKFGKEYGIVLYSSEGEGTRAVITVPLLNDKEKNTI